MQRIFLIHATRLSIDPITASFTAYWPEARLSNLMDDSLSQDLAAAQTQPWPEARVLSETSSTR